MSNKEEMEGLTYGIEAAMPYISHLRHHILCRYGTNGHQATQMQLITGPHFVDKRLDDNNEAQGNFKEVLFLLFYLCCFCFQWEQ